VVRCGGVRGGAVWRTGVVRCGAGVWQSLGMALGGLLGGVIGDHMARLSANSGRIITAQISVALGIPTFCAIFYLVPCEAHGEHFYLASFLVFLFGAVATWTSASSLRPMCAELMSSPVEQGQLVALWVMLEGITSSVFGSPLVGWLTETYGYNDHSTFNGGSNSHQLDFDTLELTTTDSANALAMSLVGVSALAWVVCLLIWSCMLKTYPRDKAAAEARGKYDKEYSPYDQNAV
jgi:MFS family permease